MNRALGLMSSVVIRVGYFRTSQLKKDFLQIELSGVAEHSAGD
jgi:hypothetical protein